MTKAIIFDCFGVLTSEGWLAFKDEYFTGRPRELKRAVELNRLLDAGAIDYEEGVREIAAMAGVTVRELDAVLRNVVPNEKLLAYIARDLKPKYRLGILSNVAGNWLESFFEAEDLRLFDVVSLSYESGILKPDPRSYESIASRLGVAVEESVFIDDSRRNVAGAIEADMRAVLYQDFDQMKAELEKMSAADAEG